MENKAVTLDSHHVAILGLTSSDITAIASVVIALCALIVSILQTRHSNRVSRIQLRPSLCFSSETLSEESHLKLVLENQGSGPAFVDGFRVYLDNDIVEAADPLSKALIVALNTRDVSFKAMNVDDGAVFKEGYQTIFLDLSFKSFPAHTVGGLIEDLSERIRIEIDYTDAFGERMQTLKS